MEKEKHWVLITLNYNDPASSGYSNHWFHYNLSFSVKSSSPLSLWQHTHTPRRLTFWHKNTLIQKYTHVGACIHQHAVIFPACRRMGKWSRKQQATAWLYTLWVIGLVCLCVCVVVCVFSCVYIVIITIFVKQCISIQLDCDSRKKKSLTNPLCWLTHFLYPFILLFLLTSFSSLVSHLPTALLYLFSLF